MKTVKYFGMEYWVQSIQKIRVKFRGRLDRAEASETERSVVALPLGVNAMAPKVRERRVLVGWASSNS